MPNKDLFTELKSEILKEVMAQVKVFFDELATNMEAMDLDLSQISDKMKGEKGDSIVGPIGPQGIQGLPGKDGTDGTDGKDAPPIDENKIVREIYSLIPQPKDGKPGAPGKDAVIDWDEVRKIIKSMIPKQTRQPMLRLGGGGDTVSAGSNITITTGSDGTKVITGAAGSGFTELTATETPNGVLTVFTFAAAAAQPSYILADNVWMKATSKAGTVNWTWNAGLKQATLTIPPNDEIYAIV